MGGLVEIIVADDPAQAAERLLPHWLHQQNTYRALRRKPDGSPLSPIDHRAGARGLAEDRAAGKPAGA